MLKIKSSKYLGGYEIKKFGVICVEFFSGFFIGFWKGSIFKLKGIS